VHGARSVENFFPQAPSPPQRLLLAYFAVLFYSLCKTRVVGERCPVVCLKYFFAPPRLDSVV